MKKQWYTCWYIFVNIPPQGEPDCSDHGTCIRRGGVSLCQCDAGFKGDDCATYVCAGPEDNPCNGNGMYGLVSKDSRSFVEFLV